MAFLARKLFVMIKKIQLILITMLSVSVGLSSAFYSNGGNDINEDSNTNDTTQVVGDSAIIIEEEIIIGDELTIENLALEMERVGIQHVDIVLSQAVLETGWFKCNNCSFQYNNLFGFLYKGKYLRFDNWKESVAYYKWWQDQLYKDGGDYYAFLKKVGYATAPDYNQKLQSVGKELNIEEIL